MKLMIWPVLEIESNASVPQHDNAGASKEILLNMNKEEKQIRWKTQ